VAVMPLAHAVEKLTAGLTPCCSGGTVCEQSRAKVSCCVVMPSALTEIVEVVSSATGTVNWLELPAGTECAWSAPS